MIERRKDKRWSAAAIRVLHATLRPGRHVEMVDVSASGAQVQTDLPLRPGARVLIRVTTEDFSLSLSAHVVRCAVSAIHPELGVTYRGALRFDDRCQRLAEPAHSFSWR